MRVQDKKCACLHRYDSQPTFLNPDIYQLLSVSESDAYWKQHCISVCSKATLRGLNLTVSRSRGLTVKKALYSFRNKLFTFLQITVPICLMWIGLTTVEDTAGFEKLSLTSTVLEDVAMVYEVTGDEDSTAWKLAKIYTFFMESSRGRPLKCSCPKLSDSLSSRNLALTRYGTEEDVVLIGASFETDTCENVSECITVFVLYNMQAYHSEAIAVAAVMKTIHRHYTLWRNNTVECNENVTAEQILHFATQPLPLTVRDARGLSAAIAHKYCFHSATTVLVSMSFFTSLFAVFLIKERTVGSKRMQHLSGLSSLVYFICTFIWDIAVHTIECIVIFLAAAYTIGYDWDKNGITLLLILMSYGIASLPLVYSMQLIFCNPRACVLVLFCVRITSGIFLPLFTSAGRLMYDSHSTWIVSEGLEISLNALVPSYSLHTEFYRMCRAADNTTTHFNTTVQFISWSALLFLLDSEVLCLARLRMHAFIASLNSKRPDGTVKNKEVDIGMEQSSSKSFLVFKNIMKLYGKRIIINDISIAISKGECFYLLGREGTGKTTLMRILTGYIHQSSGTITMNKTEGTSATSQLRVSMGYCPQENALMDEFTGKEILTLYGRLRGLPEVLLKTAVINITSSLRLSNIGNLYQDYSAVDKRKLSIAVALIGRPGIIVLDEPLSGVDYVDHKTVYQLLLKLIGTECTVILATSSTEDYINLSSRMAVMTEGRVACLSSPPVLMKKHGLGYTVVVAFQTDETGNLHSQMPFFTCAVETCTKVEILSDHEVSRLHFQDEHLDLGKLFALLEDGIKYFRVRDYSVEKTSLKHVIYTLSVCPDEEFIDLPPGAPPPFDTWPPKTSSLEPLERLTN